MSPASTVVETFPVVSPSTARLIGALVNERRAAADKTVEQISDSAGVELEFTMTAEWLHEFEAGGVIPTYQMLRFIEALTKCGGVKADLVDQATELHFDRFSELGVRLRKDHQIALDQTIAELPTDSIGSGATPIVSEVSGRDRFLVFGALALGVLPLLLSFQFYLAITSKDTGVSGANLLSATSLGLIGAMFVPRIERGMSLWTESLRPDKVRTRIYRIDEILKSVGVQTNIPLTWHHPAAIRHMASSVKPGGERIALEADFVERVAALWFLAVPANIVLLASAVSDAEMRGLAQLLVLGLSILLWNSLARRADVTSRRSFTAVQIGFGRRIP